MSSSLHIFIYLLGFKFRCRRCELIKQFLTKPDALKTRFCLVQTIVFISTYASLYKTVGLIKPLFVYPVVVFLNSQPLHCNFSFRPYLDDIKSEGTKPIPKPMTVVILSLHFVPSLLELVLSFHFFMSSK